MGVRAVEAVPASAFEDVAMSDVPGSYGAVANFIDWHCPVQDSADREVRDAGQTGQICRG